MRDVCVLADDSSKTYYMVGPGRVDRTPVVRLYSSKDLVTWHGPQTVFRVTDDLWGDIRVRGIWAPE
ncbi:MAG: hypothetical protein KDA37_03830, partial [Planctomycetales bacterium]|nr:hypothetical protein [Planctomycetales bacterium]